MQLKVIEQREQIEKLLEKHDIRFVEVGEKDICFADPVPYDVMVEIVDFLRTDAPRKELFEECWVAYNRKGSKKKSFEYWKKLTDVEKQNVMPHIKPYVASRELQFQKDFERYLRDKTFTTVVFANNKVIYDPTRLDKKDKANEVYMPLTDGALSWNDYYQKYMYIGNFDGFIPDGYTDENRPDGATIMLNNSRGTLVWSVITKTWNKV